MPIVTPKDLVRDYYRFSIEKASYEEAIRENGNNLIAIVTLKRICKEMIFIEKAFLANNLNLKKEINLYERFILEKE